MDLPFLADSRQREEAGMDETTMTMGISPARAERGRWVYSAWKHLRNFDQQAVAPFEATSLAGKTCDLLGRMRQLAPYGPAALRPLLADAGITRLEFKNTLLPLLETLGHLPGLTARRQRAQRAGAGPVAGRCDGPGRPLLGDAGSRAGRTGASF
jgi:hypothetical protein